MKTHKNPGCKAFHHLLDNPKNANSNTCECIAIKKAIKTCLDRPQITLICSSSKSCLISLKKRPTDFRYRVNKLLLLPGKQWIKEVCGCEDREEIAGNEEADKSAKQAAKQAPILEPLSFADMDRYLKDKAWWPW